MGLVGDAVKSAGGLLDLELHLLPSQDSDLDFVVRSPEAPYPHGFSLEISKGYLAWHFRVSPDPSSRPFLAKMEEIARQMPGELERACIESLTQGFTFAVNSTPFSGDSNLAAPWLSFEVFGSVEVDASETGSQIALQNGIVQALAVPVWFMDQLVAHRHIPIQGEVEGAVSVVSATKYERSRINRARCLQHFGPVCKGCGEDPRIKYGALGKDVVHVHHLQPVSTMEGPAVVDPLIDLVPLCPTCHNVVHRENPPVSLERLREQTGYKAI